MNPVSSLQPLFLVSVTPEAQCPEIAALASSSLIHRQAESFTIHADSYHTTRVASDFVSYCVFFPLVPH